MRRRLFRQRSKEVGSKRTTEDEEDLDIQARVIFLVDRYVFRTNR